MGSIERGDSLPIIRVIVMIFTSAWALKSFIQSFFKSRMRNLIKHIFFILLSKKMN